MGRGRGKGKKLTVEASHEEPGSGGEESLPAYKRRGRPQKPLKDDSDEEDAELIFKEEGDDAKPSISSKEMKGQTLQNGKKRKSYSDVKENSDLVVEEGIKSKPEDSSRPNNFRHSGSRRKSKPRRAAPAGVECN